MSNTISALLYGSAAFEGNNVPIADLEKLKNNRLLTRALVVDVINDVSVFENPPESLNDNDKISFFKSPRDSLICRLISEIDTKTNQDFICFPFFSSHFSLPVKPGEQVWVINEMLFNQTSGLNRTYWLTRIVEELSLEDTNYTHFNRKIEQKSDNSSQSQEIDSQNKKIDSKKIIENSVSRKIIIREPIPRFTKRPSDLTIQGSNNTLISLGQDRGFDFENRPLDQKKSNSNDLPEEKTGTIDIVAGRGRYFSSNEDETKKDRKGKKALGETNSTKPFIVKNSLNTYETDKNPELVQDIDSNKNSNPGNSKSNPKEGDPDFLVDASRVYVTENSKIDKKLGTKSLSSSLFAGELQDKEGPFVVLKSDNVRIVARNFSNEEIDNKIPENVKKSGGTIRIIKEGNKDDSSSIYLEDDGSVQISGKKIFIGKPGNGSGPGPGNSEPYIKYSEFESLWERTMDSFTDFCDTVLTHVTPGFGNPSLQINDAANTLKTKLSSIKSDVQKIKSERIFGE